MAQDVVKKRASRAAKDQENGKQWSWAAFGRYIAVIVVVFIALAPLYWTFITSVKDGTEINAYPPTLFPHHWNFNNYIDAFTKSDFFLPTLRNSVIIAVVTTVVSLLFGILCAYALGRTKFYGKGAMLAIVLSVNMFPFIAIVGPLYILFTNGLYIYNTYAALIVPNIVATLPLTIWFLTSFFRDLPADLEEAARIDGASRLQALWHVIVPLTAPGVFAAAILSFIAVWNDFLFGLTLTSSTAAQPVTVGITFFNSEHQTSYGMLAAAAIVVTIPLVILVLFLQRRIVSGLTAGAVKG
ncbi:carbohydrate ABC transporter membrane protein 2 (CUT1 family) [Thermosporothrix hazakensis]|jgi:ABC-type glycerol-3-phosphate transport system permease component|uniref:Carbohydrate ABC transporter membrane protein 2 (CUT1 family) n=1 Tax=Thermosporothrix hazakensis TaxID=644383 RepID=A0A326U3B6_THEHA|nr:carbohydrate ABC transporter permease [Thermosporothrix hazakensis]PZW25620.1 carbohydrate ABC transporter membrane protein 2 (CUT1 family) [Thermosporothrix hazakensis]GCE48115.1 ABC transporter permease [Thermosporothrix hazakensis]